MNTIRLILEIAVSEMDELEAYENNDGMIWVLG